MFIKRGQLTLIVIVAIVIVVLILAAIFYKVDLFGAEKFDPKVELLKDEVSDCFKKEFGESVEIIGIQGGYIEVPEPREIVSVHYFAFGVPYYYHESAVYIPSIDEIKNEIRNDAVTNIDRCYEEIKDKEGYDFVDYDTSGLFVEISGDSITFTVNSLMTVGYDNKSSQVNMIEYPVTLNSDIYNMHQIARFIAEYLKMNNEWMPFSDISLLSEQYDLYVEVNDASDGYSSDVIITTRKQEFYPSQFYFKNRYGHSDLEDIGPLIR